MASSRGYVFTLAIENPNIATYAYGPEDSPVKVVHGIDRIWIWTYQSVQQRLDLMNGNDMTTGYDREPTEALDRLSHIQTTPRAIVKSGVWHGADQAARLHGSV